MGKAMSHSLPALALVLVFLGLPGCGTNARDVDQARRSMAQNAKICLQGQRAEEAVSWAQKSLELAEKAHGKNSLEAAKDWILLAECQWKADHSERADAAVRQAASILRQQAVSTEEVMRGFFSLCSLERERGKYDSARLEIENWRQKARSLKNPRKPWEGSALLMAAMVFQDQEEYELAGKQFKAAREWMEANPQGYEPDSRARLYVYNALYAVYGRSFQDGLVFLDKARNSVNQSTLKDREWEYVLGILESVVPELAKGDEAKEPDGREKRRAWLLANSLKALGYNRQAIPWFKLGQELARKIPNTNEGELARYYLYIAECHFHCGEKEEMRPWLDKAVRILEKDQLEPLDLLDLARRCGTTFFDLNQFSEAAKWLERSQKQLEEAGWEDEEGKLINHAVMGLCYARLGKKEKAAEALAKCLAALKEIQLEPSGRMFVALLTIGELELFLKKPTEALAHFEKAAEMANAAEPPIAQKDLLKRVRDGIAQATENLEESARVKE